MVDYLIYGREGQPRTYSDAQIQQAQHLIAKNKTYAAAGDPTMQWLINALIEKYNMVSIMPEQIQQRQEQAAVNETIKQINEPGFQGISTAESPTGIAAQQIEAPTGYQYKSTEKGLELEKLPEVTQKEIPQTIIIQEPSKLQEIVKPIETPLTPYIEPKKPETTQSIAPEVALQQAIDKGDIQQFSGTGLSPQQEAKKELFEQAGLIEKTEPIETYVQPITQEGSKVIQQIINEEKSKDIYANIQPAYEQVNPYKPEVWITESGTVSPAITAEDVTLLAGGGLALEKLGVGFALGYATSPVTTKAIEEVDKAILPQPNTFIGKFSKAAVEGAILAKSGIAGELIGGAYAKSIVKSELENPIDTSFELIKSPETYGFLVGGIGASGFKLSEKGNELLKSDGFDFKNEVPIKKTPLSETFKEEGKAYAKINDEVLSNEIEFYKPPKIGIENFKEDLIKEQKKPTFDYVETIETQNQRNRLNAGLDIIEPVKVGKNEIDFKIREAPKPEVLKSLDKPSKPLTWDIEPSALMEIRNKANRLKSGADILEIDKDIVKQIEAPKPEVLKSLEKKPESIILDTYNKLGLERFKEKNKIKKTAKQISKVKPLAFDIDFFGLSKKPKTFKTLKDIYKEPDLTNAKTINVGNQQMLIKLEEPKLELKEELKPKQKEKIEEELISPSYIEGGQVGKVRKSAYDFENLIEKPRVRYKQEFIESEPFKKKGNLILEFNGIEKPKLTSSISDKDVYVSSLTNATENIFETKDNLNFIPIVQPTKTSINQDLKLDNLIKNVDLNLPKQNMNQIIKQPTIDKQIQPQPQGTFEKLIFKQPQLFNYQFPKQNISIRQNQRYKERQNYMYDFPRETDLLFPLKKESKERKKRLRQVAAYSLFIKRKGKFNPYATNLSRGKALKLGSDLTLRNLSRTFKIVKTGVKDEFLTDEIFNPRQDIFRNYKIRKGQPVFMNDIFIQRTRANLQSRQEKYQIQEAKRLKRLIGY